VEKIKFILLREDAWHGTALCSGRGKEQVEKVLRLFSFEPWKKNLGCSYELCCGNSQF
jgi:hypothetical protein